MSELLYIGEQSEFIKIKFEKILPGSRKLQQAHEKVCDENETKKKKQRTCKNVIHGRKPFIMPIQKTSENNLRKLQGNHDRYNKGSKWVNWCQGDGFRA